MSDKDDKSGSIDLARRKEEAFRLKTLAEEKYNSGDLDSAVAYADRAHDLHPTVSGLRQMRTAFEILRAAAAAAAFPILDGSGEKQKPTPDYYTILQVQRFSHINSIKKQYKKLALTLHPDKNPFAASEEAFKLVGEAARVLSDKIRRKEYDMRLRIAMQSEAAEAVAVEVGEEGAGETFWTTCSACRLLHQFQRKYLGHNLVCPKCKKTFKAVEVEKGKDDEGNGGVVGKNEGVEGGNTRASARIQERVAKGGYVGSVEKFGLGAKRRNSNLGEVSESSAAKVARNEVNGAASKTEERVEKLGESDGVEKGRFKKMKKLVNVNGFGNVADGGVVEIVDNKTSKGAEVREEESMTLSQMQLMVKKKKKTKELVKGNPSTKAKAANAEKLKVNGLEEETNKDEGQIEKENVREEGSVGEMQNVREEESVEEMENVREEQRAKEMAEKEKEKVVNFRGSSNWRRVSKFRNLEEERSKEMEEEAEKEREAEAVKEKDANVRGSLNRRRVSKLWNLEEERAKEMEGEAEKEREEEAVKEKEANVRGNSNRRRVSKDRNLEEERVKEMEREAEKEREEEAMKEKKANVRGNSNRRRVSKDRNLEEERSKEMEEDAEKEREEEAVKEKKKNVRGSLNRRRVSKDRNLEQERAKEMEGEGEKEREEEAVQEKEANVRGNSNQRRVSKDRNLEEEREKETEEEVEKEKEEEANVRGNSNRRRVSKDRNRVEERVKEREEEAEMEKEANLRGNLKRRRVQKVRNIEVVNATSKNHLYLENEMHISPEKDNSEILMVEKEKEKEMGVTKDKRERRRVSKYRNPNTLNRKSSNNIVDSDVERLIASKKGNLEIMAVEDSDFHDFDKDRRERSFKKGQVWAVYDDVDAMPRHYALINEIISLNPFEVTLSWLDLQNNRDEEIIDWLKKGFNVSCGIFQVSSEVTVRYLNLFSHIVYCERAARELYRIYPKKGSIWAVYSCSDQEAEERNEARRYGVVVTLSSYSDMHGLSIAYLEKVEGFRTVFKRREMGPKAVVCLGAKDMKIFSHQIPAKKLSGEEASGLPKNCWELDPASLTPQMLLTAL